MHGRLSWITKIDYKNYFLNINSLTTIVAPIAIAAHIPIITSKNRVSELGL